MDNFQMLFIRTTHVSKKKIINLEIWSPALIIAYIMSNLLVENLKLFSYCYTTFNIKLMIVRVTNWIQLILLF